VGQRIGKKGREEERRGKEGRGEDKLRWRGMNTYWGEIGIEPKKEVYSYEEMLWSIHIKISTCESYENMYIFLATYMHKEYSVMTRNGRHFTHTSSQHLDVLAQT
jgi:hypothetical protein